MSIYDEVIDAGENSEDFPGLYDEAFTKLIEDIKDAASRGRREFRWFETDYPSARGKINGELLGEWLLIAGFRIAYIPNTEPRVWICRWEGRHDNSENFD